MNSFDLLKFRNQLLSENSLVEAKDHSFTFNYNTDPDDVEYIQRVLDNAGVDAIAKAGTFDDEMIVRAFDAIGLRKARKAIEADGFEISEVKMTNADKVGSDGVATEDTMEEGTLEEMASFYKLTDDSPEAKAAIVAAKEKYKPGTTLYNTLDTLEKTGEIDYKELAKSTGKDMATFNNPKSRNVLEKDLAAFVQAGSSPSAVRTGRPADPNKAAASPKLKITNPKPKSNSTKLKDLAPADAFAGMDDEEIEMEKQAMKAAKGNKRLGTAVEKLAQVTKEMKSLAKDYQAAKGTPEEAGIIAQLKDLTAEKKALEKKTAPRQMSAADLMGGEDL